MSPWQYFDLEADADERSIKRAYAKRLKSTRPDDDREAFQALREQYQQALALARRESVVSFDRIEDNDAQLKQLFSCDKEVLEDTSVLDEIPRWRDIDPHALRLVKEEPEESLFSSCNHDTNVEVENLDDEKFDQILEAAEFQSNTLNHELVGESAKATELNRLLLMVDALLMNKRRLVQKKHWLFLQECPYLLDFDFNRDLGTHVFNRVLMHNGRAARTGGRGLWRQVSPVDGSVLDYCEGLFGWSFDRERLSSQVTSEDPTLILDSLLDSATSKRPARYVRGGASLLLDQKKSLAFYDDMDGGFYGLAGLFQRLMAAMFDFFIVFLVSFVGWCFLESTGITEDFAAKGIASMLVAVMGYFPLAFLFESSSWQATPGKRLMGFKVKTRNLEPMSYGRGLWRLISLGATLPFFKIILFVNALLGNKLIHDRMSSTCVIITREKTKR